MKAESKPRRSTPVRNWIATVFMFAIAGFFLFAYADDKIFKSPPSLQPISIVSLTGLTPPDQLGRPLVYHYLVRLSDGSQTSFSTRFSHAPGERVMVWESRTRWLGRLSLTEEMPIAVNAPGIGERIAKTP